MRATEQAARLQIAVEAATTTDTVPAPPLSVTPLLLSPKDSPSSAFGLLFIFVHAPEHPQCTYARKTVVERLVSTPLRCVVEGKGIGAYKELRNGVLIRNDGQICHPRAVQLDFRRLLKGQI